MHMKALRKTQKGIGFLELQDISPPEINAGELLVKVMATGICGTDLHIEADEFMVNPPVTVGHEFCGTVVQKADDITEFEIGDRVVSMTTVSSCGKCDYCLSERAYLCEQRTAIGCLVNGGFAEYIKVPSSTSFKVPDNITDDTAALTEPLACVCHSLLVRNKIKTQDRVFISGPGPIGLLAAQVCIAVGAEVMIAGTNNDQSRLNIAREIGVKETINVQTDEIQKYLNAPFFDHALECSGHVSSLKNCLLVLKKGGHLTQIALYGQDVQFDFDLLVRKEITVHTGFTSSRKSWRYALDLLSKGSINLGKLVSHRLALSEWESGFNLVKSKQGLKILLLP